MSSPCLPSGQFCCPQRKVRCHRAKPISWHSQRTAHRRATGTGREDCLHASKVFNLDHDVIEAVLTGFWQVRGVRNRDDRHYLISLALSHVQTHGRDVNGMGQRWDSKRADVLPGMHTLWQLKCYSGLSEQLQVHDMVVWVSIRLIELAVLFGVDCRRGSTIGYAVVREPRLLHADRAELAGRVAALRIEFDSSVDVAGLIVAQPALLLRPLSLTTPSSGGRPVPAAMQRGLTDDLDSVAWTRHFQGLGEYVRVRGCPHCGFRESDPEELARWCRAQRAAASSGELLHERRAALMGLGFELNEERAEWMVWYCELKRSFRACQEAESELATHTGTESLYLTNWCSIQRIARRSSVLDTERIDLLDQVGFDWAGADPLS